jgi:heat shock protein HtpX
LWTWWRRRLNDLSAREHQTLLARGLGAPPSSDRRAVIALSALVHLVTLVPVALLVLVLLAPWLWLVKALVALLLLGVLWEVGPWRPNRRPSGYELPAERAPALHAVVADVARRLGVSPPSLVLVDDEVNAVWQVYGWRRRRALTLGLPLWAVLDGAGKVSLLGHELGHEASGDPRSGWFVGSAIGSLDAWRELLSPVVDEADGSPGGFVVLVAQWISVLLLLPVVAALGLLELLLGTLALRTSQRAEHVADAIGARLSGRAGAVRAETALVHAETLRFALEVAVRADPQADVWDTARAHMASVPDHERARLLRLAAVQLQRIDASHPPTTRRLELLERADDGPAELVLDEETEQRIDGEIRSAGQYVRRRLLDEARS